VVETDQLLSRPEVARILGVSEGTVTKLEGAGLLPRVGLSGVRVRRYRLSDVQTVMRQRQAANPIAVTSDGVEIRMTEIAADSNDYEGNGPSTPEASRSALQDKMNKENEVARILSEGEKGAR
jgi:predicted DNA-binding transcriptional regulator AlpA